MTNPQALEALKPCPFCGHTHARRLVSSYEMQDEDADDYRSHTETFAIICNAERPDGPGGCGASGGFFELKVHAVAAWNRRAATQPAPQPEAQALPSAEQIEKARKWDHIQPYLCKTCGGFGLVDRSTRDGPDAEPCPACNELASPAPAPLSEEIRRELIEDTREVFDAKGLETPQVVRDVIEYVDSWLTVYIQKTAERSGVIGLDGGM